jgi:ubiquinone/menaquinone biosynthesis C-methylase UbiE
MRQTNEKRRKLVPEMEGRTARWYARQRGSDSQLVEYRRQATRLTEGLPDGARILEVAPGPGYHAIETARRGFQVTTVDISHTFVEIARENAQRAGASIDVRHGDVSNLPFDADSFDLVVCQAAFKNFTQPVRALDEMYRVLRAGRTAVIQDLCRDASGSAIDEEVHGMRLSPVNALMTTFTLRMLRRRAYSRATFQRLAAESAFRTCDIELDGISIEVRLTKPA